MASPSCVTNHLKVAWKSIHVNANAKINLLSLQKHKEEIRDIIDIIHTFLFLKLINLIKIVEWIIGMQYDLIHDEPDISGRQSCN